MPNTLPVSNYVSVAINLAPGAAQAQSLNSLLVLDSDPTIDTQERIRAYTSLSAVVADFGTSGNVYNCAALYFAQVPQPSIFYAGRWVSTASKGGLRCGTLSSAQQAIASWNAITNGSFRVTLNGGAVTNVTGLNFSGASSMYLVASIIQAALAGSQFYWNPTFNRFEVNSTATGASSSVSFLSATGTGTDISTMLAGTAPQGAYIFSGQAPETAAACASLFDAQFGQQWYAMMITGASDADQVAVAAVIEASSNKHVLGVSTGSASCLVPTDTTNVAYQLKQLGYKKTMVQYSSNNAYAAASLIGRAITTNFTGNNTTIDLMYKQEPGIVAEYLNQTQANALNGFNANAFVALNNGVNIIQYGNMSSGDPIDLITGTDWLAVALQNAAFNALYTSATKIPQTEAGSNQLANVLESVCVQAVQNGFLAPGIWTTGGFGLLNQNDFLAKGFYIYPNPLSLQSAADRTARKAPLIQIAAKTAGAFRSVNIAVSVNR